MPMSHAALHEFVVHFKVLRNDLRYYGVGFLVNLDIAEAKYGQWEVNYYSRGRWTYGPIQCLNLLVYVHRTIKVTFYPQ